MKIKSFFLLLLFMFVLQFVYSQDLIVKQTGDSINCKIKKIENTYIIYSQKLGNESKEASINSNDVRKYVFGYFPEEENVENKSEAKIVPDIYKHNEERKEYTWLVVGINGGMGYRLKEIKNTTPYELGDYYEKLRRGINFSGDIIYYYNKYVGIGINGSYFSSYNEASIKGGAGIGNGSMSDNIILWNVGVVMSGLYESRWFIVYLNAGVGSANYENDYSYINRDIKLTGSAFYFGSDMGIDFKLGSNVALGLKASYNSGVLKSIKRDGEIQNLDRDSYVDLQNVRLTAGIKILIR
jgi:hypothetical protein